MEEIVHHAHQFGKADKAEKARHDASAHDEAPSLVVDGLPGGIGLPAAHRPGRRAGDGAGLGAAAAAHAALRADSLGARLLPLGALGGRGVRRMGAPLPLAVGQLAKEQDQPHRPEYSQRQDHNDPREEFLIVVPVILITRHIRGLPIPK